MQTVEPITLHAARARVAELSAAKSSLERALNLAVALNDGHTDLNELNRAAHRLANDLAAAEDVLREATEREVAAETQRNRARFAEVTTELRAARAKFAEHYREAALALGRWYSLGEEAGKLATALANPLGNGGFYYPPDLKNVLAEASEDPNPLPAMKDGGYSELQTAASWRRHAVIVPLKEKR